MQRIYRGIVFKSLPKPIQRLLVKQEIEYEKAKHCTPAALDRRIAMQRDRVGRPLPPPAPPPRVPEHYYEMKRSHWYRDHLDRIEDMVADAVCRENVGFSTASPTPGASSAMEAFNFHITPIGETYQFDLRMDLMSDRLVLLGDVGKATSVLLVLCRESRTPEIDWLLDIITLAQIDLRGDWSKTWDKKLRHTKRGKWWRKQRDKQVEREEAKTRDRTALVLGKSLDETPTLGPKIGRDNLPAAARPDPLAEQVKHDALHREAQWLDPKYEAPPAPELDWREDERVEPVFDRTAFQIINPFRKR
jgi:hypothetical protein